MTHNWYLEIQIRRGSNKTSQEFKMQISWGYAEYESFWIGLVFIFTLLKMKQLQRCIKSSVTPAWGRSNIDEILTYIQYVTATHLKVKKHFLVFLFHSTDWLNRRVRKMIISVRLTNQCCVIFPLFQAKWETNFLFF